MHILQGIAVSPGVAIGEALVIGNEGFHIPRRFLARDEHDEETRRVDRAIEEVAAQIERNRDAITTQLGEHYGAIFSAHLQMLRDRRLHDEIETLIREKHFSAEYAVSRTLGRYAKAFQELESGFFAERAHDIFDLERNLLRSLLGAHRTTLSNLNAPAVVLAPDLTPSETATLDREHVLGFVTEGGGPGGHTAIVAKGLEIPAVVGAGRFLTEVSGGDWVIIDGDTGRVILQPDDETLARYREQVEAHRTRRVRLESLRELPAQTRDGARIEIGANIEFPHEAPVALERGADGIGLYRTEFLYLGADTEPTEEVHYEAYADVVRAMQGRPVVIRTLDLGADKMGLSPHAEPERNPFLGVRSIRLSLRNLAQFRVQLRAILRASALGDVRLMFPLITTLQELRQAKMVLADVREDLIEAGADFNREIPLGMMVEAPAAVIMLDRFCPEVDFLSIGANDLIQYTLAVDRSNTEVADLYQAADPAVLRLIDSSIQSARRAGIEVSACGQMSGDSAYTMLLLGLGLRSLSVPPAAVPEVKQICRSVEIAQCERVARRALAMDTSLEIEHFLREELRKAAPQLALPS